VQPLTEVGHHNMKYALVEPRDKIVVFLVYLLYCDYRLLEFSYSLVLLLLSLIHISKEQSSEEFSSLHLYSYQLDFSFH
jgi:hypothetical protein